MAFSARVLADSIAPNGRRLITMEWIYGRPIHSEIMTHRELSRNAASSRAIPVQKMLARIKEDPFIPIWWGKNEPGMQAWAEIDDKEGAIKWWLEARDLMLAHAQKGMELGLHKQIVNRLVEPWMWITVIASSTSLTNLFGLRDHKDAEPHFQKITRLMKDAVAASTPKYLPGGRWHLPLVHDEDWDLAAQMQGFESLSVIEKHYSLDTAIKMVEPTLIKVSVGRCARVSYLTHDGKRDLGEDVKLHDKLIVAEPLHASPGEHVAMSLDMPDWFELERKKHPAVVGDHLPELAKLLHEWKKTPIGHVEHHEDIIFLQRLLSEMRSGNFSGWMQYRKTLPNEYIGESMP